MVKKWKALFLLVLMLGSVCLANAEASNGEAYGKTGEEGIAAQFEDENIQRMFTLLDEVANEPIENKEITNKEIQNRLNKIYKKNFANARIMEIDKDGISFLYNLVLFQNLSDDDKQKLIDRYYNTEALFNMKDTMLVFEAYKFASLCDGKRMIADLNFFGSEKFQELIGVMNDELIQASKEFKKGNFNGIHCRALMVTLNQTEECLKGSGKIVVIREVVVLPLYDLLGYYLLEIDEGKKYIDDYDFTVKRQPDLDNPSNVEVGVLNYSYLQKLYNSIDGVVETTLGI